MELQTATLIKHNKNIQDMIDFMEANYEEILAHNFNHSDYMMHLFDALLTSKKDVFRSMTQCLKELCDIGKYVQLDALIDFFVTKYNNMVKQQLWNQTDPKDTKILVLTTKLEVMESTFNTTVTKHSKGVLEMIIRILSKPYWQKIKKVKTIERDGKKILVSPPRIFVRFMGWSMYASQTGRS